MIRWLKRNLVKVKNCDGDYTMYWAESKNWNIRWLKKPKGGWGFLTVLGKDALKDN